jgi:NAD(P)-dependent dehydrogenase (short-subunit alcohol dehydrogenase family)
MSEHIEQKVVWITGAGSGLGRAMAHAFARRGLLVALSGRRVERLQNVAQEISSFGKTLIIPCDVRSSSETQQAVERLIATTKRLDIAVANAGFGVTGRFEDITMQQWRGQLDTNILGVVHTIAAALPALRTARGRIGVVSSVSGLFATRNASPYTTSKFALTGLCRSLAIELAPENISVTLLMPGFVHSEIAQVDNDGLYKNEREDRRPKKLMWPTAKAARIMVESILQRKPEVVFTAHGKFAGFMGAHFPSLVRILHKLIQSKKP